jgi:hypothetical protein
MSGQVHVVAIITPAQGKESRVSNSMKLNSLRMDGANVDLDR